MGHLHQLRSRSNRPCAAADSAVRAHVPSPVVTPRASALLHDIASRRTDAGLPTHCATKFDAPQARPEHLPRERQLAAIDPHARLLLVCAPAGYGKTTLLRQWITRDASRPSAWVQLAPEDDGLFAFWIAIVSGIAGARPQIGKRSLGALAGPFVDVHSAVLAPLIDDLRSDDGAGLDLVLDDLHLITDRAAHETLGWLVENAPANLRIAIATRHAPGLPLGRLRARGDLAELRGADLRFDTPEVRGFLNDRLGLDLGDAELDALEERAEGWPAGLYLAALSLRGAPDREDGVAAFAGDDELIVDFLAPELLRGLDAETRSFLLRTSILESFCAPLCDAVAQCGVPSADVLGELQRTNLFLVALDRRRRWFRYERLFADLLRAELEAAEPALVAELHRRAARWHDGAGNVRAAIAHDLQAGDREHAALRIARSWASLYNSRDWPQVAAWMTQLPEDELAHVPGFIVAKAWIAGVLGMGDEVQRLAAIARAQDDGGALPDGSSCTESALALIDAGFPFGDVGRARRCAQRAAALDRGDAQVVNVAFALGFTGFWAGAPERDVRCALERAVRLGADRPFDAAIVTGALAHLAYLDLLAGDSARAHGHIARARRHARERGIDEHPPACMLGIASGWLLLADGRTAAAGAELERALELAHAYGEPLHVANATRLLAECRERAGDDGAAGLLAQARAIVELRCPDPGILAQLVDMSAADIPVSDGVALTISRDGCEPLSERELEVLRLLGGPLSLPAIAGELFVAHNTVKTHTRTIYRKLGAASRGEAVARGRTLRLL